MDQNDATALLQIRQRLENIKAAPQFFNRFSRAEAETKASEFYTADITEMLAIVERTKAQAQEHMDSQHGALKAAIEALVKALLERGADAHAPEVVVAKQLL